MRITRGLLASGLVLAIWACDDEAAPAADQGPTAGGGGGGDVLDQGAFGGSGGAGGGADLDATVSVDAANVGGRGFGEPCEGNLDCASGWCVPFEDHNVCSRMCLTDECPNGWGCHAVANTVPDVVFICFPPGNRLCGACVQDEDCPGGRCHEVDGQRVCGLDCAADETCPPGFACGDDGQCAPQNGSCTCHERTDGHVRLCELSNDHGTCVGRETCDPEQGWVGCDAQTPAAEICNALDDDCNGLPDDIVGLGDVCTREVEVGGAVLSCGGRLVCTAEAAEPQCTALEPGPERCNFVDDDCDGDTDEGFEARGTVCVVGQGQCERVGVHACSEDGASVACDVAPGAPVDELCNGLDDDCDGQTDEAWPDLNQGCSAGEGACRRAGTLRCAEDGQGTACSAAPGAPEAERCNGVDDDCDGQSDETFAGLFTPCEVGVGACRRQGFNFCTDDGAGVACTAQAAAPGQETCNGLDDDCDGTIDEGYPGVNRPCSTGQGLCLRPGVTVCSPDGADVVCNAVLGEAVDEVCNGLDDDCDGRTDEAFPELDAVCEVGVGACARIGVTRCDPEGEGTVCSARPVAPSPDICNGLDDDCDGQTDEGFPLREQACTAGQGLCARAGLYRCTEDGAGVACDAEAAPAQAEICDGFDNDCDGQTDEGYPQLNTPCSAGEGVCRRPGIRVCTADGAGVTCNAEAGAPQAEVCNGLDDNCDGTIDEGFAGLGTACTAGQGACLANGVRGCSPDGAAVICDAVAGAPAAERCNAVDDDCDGQTDEDFAGLGTACTAGLGACLRQGVRLCAPDGAGVACTAEPGAPAPELCNAIDDDCDGQTDEDHPALNRACEAGVGACRRVGVQICTADGAGTACDAEAGAPIAEACNGLDDDCDGQTDERWPSLGRACEAGVGACRRGGVFVCGGDGVICDAEAGAPAADTCNYRDDDCDGATDEAFVDADGRYTTVAHCGACNADCAALWNPAPAAFGVAPRCAVQGGVAQCAFDCLPGFRDADGVPDNGCELAIDADAIYVSTPENGGVFADDCGLVDAPCATITDGLDRALAEGRARVRVSDGVYREAVQLVNGVSLLGGHHRVTWRQAPELNVTVIDGPDAGDDAHRAGVRAIGLDSATLAGFVVRSASPLVGGNSYGVYLRDCGPGVVIRDNRIVAGDGGRGLDGQAGASGDPGRAGALGLAAIGVINPVSCARAGGAGGQRTCGGAVVDGGRGGAQGACPTLGAPAGSGGDGGGLLGGDGGDGAWGFEAPTANRCLVDDGGPTDPRSGQDGFNGGDGRGGDGAGAAGVAATHWTGTTGQPGATGVHGGGGGGGGAAAGVDVAWSADLGVTAYDLGATGGGGGAGGCAGLGGLGGEAGGGSFGLYVSFAGVGPAQAADLPTITGNLIQRGLGGNGGAGGIGGGGGEGGPGGGGGPVGTPETVNMAFCSLQGGDGGQGGRGGHGGGGGGGQGGISYDVFVANANGLALPYAAQNDFGLAGDFVTGGQGGVGGNSSNVVDGRGAAGAQGASGRIGAAP